MSEGNGAQFSDVLTVPNQDHGVRRSSSRSGSNGMPKLHENQEYVKSSGSGIKTTSSFTPSTGFLRIASTESMCNNTSFKPAPVYGSSSPSERSNATQARSLASSATTNFAECFAQSLDIRAEFTYQENRRVLRERKLMLVPPGSMLPGWMQTQRIMGISPSKLTDFLYRFFTSRLVAIFLQKLALTSASMVIGGLFMETSCRLASERRWVADAKYFHFCMSAIYAICSVGEFVSRFNVFLEEVRLKLSDMTCCLSMCHSKLDQVESLGIPTGRAAAECWNPTVSPLWLTLDMLSLIGMFGEAVHLNNEPEGVPTFAMYVCLFHVLKLWRWLLPAPIRSPLASTLWGQILELFFSLVLFTHIYACVFGIIAIIEVDMGRPTWADDVLLVVDEESEQTGCYDFYMAALYFSSYTVTSIGYGDICPANTFERGVDALGMIIGQMYLAKVFADLTFITSIHQHWQAEHHKRVTQTSAALSSLRISGTLSDRALAYQDFVWEVQKEQTAKEVLEGLSPLLKEELKVIIHHRLVIQAPFLQKLSIRALRCIVDSLRDCIYLPGDFIMRRGDLGSELYFLRDGCAAIFLLESAPAWHDSELKLLRRGDYFGEVAVLTGAPRSSWVMARTYCVCSVLHRSAIDRVIATEPTCISALARSMSRAMDLKREFSWAQVGQRLDEEFEDEDNFFRFLCSGEDGEAPAGHVTWSRYQTLMQRLGIPILDQKLLWVELDTQERGEVGFDDVISLLETVNKSEEKTFTPKREMDQVSGKTGPPQTDTTNSPTKRPRGIVRSPTTRARRSSGCMTSPMNGLHEPLTMLQHRVDELAAQSEVQFSDLRSRIHDIASHLGIPSRPQPALPESRRLFQHARGSSANEELLQPEGSRTADQAAAQHDVSRENGELALRRRSGASGDAEAST